MQWVSRVIDFMALPWNGIGLEGLGGYWPRPDFDLLLVRAYIVKITQTRCRAANEAALINLNHTQHACQRRWIEQDIIVKVVNVGRAALLEQKLSLLR